jgi:hypothetical protein
MSYVQAGAVAGSFPVGGTGSASKIDTGAAIRGKRRQALQTTIKLPFSWNKAGA